jgi:2,4-dienoyl-CoA reductase (NADPH2)
MDHLPPADDGANVLDAMDVALGHATPGDTIVIIHGGKIGLTLAESLKQQGKDVTVVEPNRRIAADVSPTWKWRHTSWLKELEIDVLTSTRVTRIGKTAVTVVDGEGKEQTLAADTVIIAGPSRPNQGLYNDFQWMVDETYAVGDATIPRDLTEAIRDGYRLGCRL